jgi:hypothetical protein
MLLPALRSICQRFTEQRKYSRSRGPAQRDISHISSHVDLSILLKAALMGGFFI